MNEATAIWPEAMAKIDETFESIRGKNAWIRSNCRSVASSETTLGAFCAMRLEGYHTRACGARGARILDLRPMLCHSPGHDDRAHFRARAQDDPVGQGQFGALAARV